MAVVDAQAGYHRQIYGAFWDDGVASAVSRQDDLAGLDQMGHFGTAGCDLIVTTLGTLLAGRRIACLELGTGFGGALRYVLRGLQGRLDVRLAVGVDVVADHCRILRTMNQAAQPTAPVVPVCASVSALGLRGGCFDAVFAAGSMSHFSDTARVLAECHRVLRPGGVLTFVEEVSLLDGEPSARFRALHPPDVFVTSSRAQREAQLRASGFTDLAITDLSDWAASLLRRRLMAMRVYRRSVDAYLGEERARRIVEIMTSTSAEITAGVVTPVHVTARRS